MPRRRRSGRRGWRPTPPGPPLRKGGKEDGCVPATRHGRAPSILSHARPRGGTRALRVHELDVERHGPGGVGGAAQARVEGPDAGLESVEHAFGDLRAVDVVLGDLHHGPVHRQVVLAGRDDQVDALDQPVLIHLVVVEERAAGASLAPTPSSRLIPALARSGSELRSGSSSNRSISSSAARISISRA